MEIVTKWANWGLLLVLATVWLLNSIIRRDLRILLLPIPLVKTSVLPWVRWRLLSLLRVCLSWGRFSILSRPGEERYICWYCWRTFRYPNSLKAHLRFHCVLSSGAGRAYLHQEHAARQGAAGAADGLCQLPCCQDLAMADLKLTDGSYISWVLSIPLQNFFSNHCFWKRIMLGSLYFW